MSLIPPDRKQCQVETKLGSFMSFGNPTFERCKNKPNFIVKEIIPGQDGRRGSMSICSKHLPSLIKQKGESFFTKKTI